MLISRKDAKKFLYEIRAAYIPEHEYAQVDPEDFKRLDHKYYNSTAQKLIEYGFRFLGDIEDVTLSKVHPDQRTFSKCLVSPDGTIRADIFHTKPSGRLRIQLIWSDLLKDRKVLLLETEFTNGCFICTSNGMPGSVMTAPPEIAFQHHPPSTSVSELLEIHKARIAEYIKDKPDAECVPVSSLNDVFASSNRMAALESAFRDGIPGGYLPEEMERITGGKGGIGREILYKMQQIELEQTQNPGC